MPELPRTDLSDLRRRGHCAGLAGRPEHQRRDRRPHLGLEGLMKNNVFFGIALGMFALCVVVPLLLK